VLDLHSHLIPGVDDGAANLDESRRALTKLTEHSVQSIITTPHVSGMVTTSQETLAPVLSGIDTAWMQFQQMARDEFPHLSVARGAEVMLDTPTPDLSDPRLRLAGTSFVLVEFPGFAVPPHSVDAIFDLKMRGWNPVIAHPERYHGIGQMMDVVAEWLRVGGLLQVNAGSLTGRYSAAAQYAAWTLLYHGWVSYLSSDFHAREPCGLTAAYTLLDTRGGTTQRQLLTQINPSRLLANLPPHDVPPITRSWRARVRGVLLRRSHRP
jgi:protein-tyrosine phosphatase